MATFAMDRPLVLAAAVLTALTLSACSGGDKGEAASGGGSTPPSGSAPPAAPPPVAAPPPLSAPAPAAPPNGFTVPAQAPQLLPFSVRLQRVAAVAGVPTSDPLLATLRANRTELGDHDYANSVKTDLGWTALKMSVWVRSVQPVCQSDAMRRRYADLPANLPQLVEAAFGRAATAQDTTDVQASLNGLTLSPTARYQTLCLAVLSSMEFVAQ